MLWEILAAVVAAVTSVWGSVKGVQAIMEHERKACDTRLDAYKEGLQHGEQERKT